MFSGIYIHIDILRNKNLICVSFVVYRYIVQILVIYTSKMVNESHPHFFLNWLTSHVTVCHWFLISNAYWLFFHYAFECPIIPKSCLWMSYNSQNYACKSTSQNYAGTGLMFFVLFHSTMGEQLVQIVESKHINQSINQSVVKTVEVLFHLAFTVFTSEVTRYWKY